MIEKLQKMQFIIFALIIVSGLLIATKFVTGSLSRDGISVTGSAYKIVKSDSGKLSFNIKVQAPTKAEAYKIMKNQLPQVEKYLNEKGITSIEIKNYHGYYNYKYNSVARMHTNEVESYNLSQPIEIVSNDVNKIKEISLDIQNLLEKNIDININQTSYFYSNLSDLKVELLELATIDSMQRASAMLKATNNKVGKIQSVKMGVFQITEVDSTNVSDMGINDTSTIDKKVTAVANVVFKIK